MKPSLAANNEIDICGTLNGDEGNYNDDIIAALKAAIEEFVKTQTW